MGIRAVKKKKEFSGLPDSLVLRALEKARSDEKQARAILRKYFGLFLTRKVLRAKDVSVLRAHFSTKKRDYLEFYGKIFEGLGRFEKVFDIGCGVNGFSYPFLREVAGDVSYAGFEAVRQIVETTNKFFESRGFFKCKVFWQDIFLWKPDKRTFAKRNAFFLFQVIDALEFFERNFSKKLLENIFESCQSKDIVVISFSVVSIGGRKRLLVRRNWLLDFLKERGSVLKDFVIFEERVVVVRKK